MKREGLVLGMDEDEYHGGPEFSSSAAKEILKTPLHYKHVYLDGHREKKKAWDIGTAVHSKVLGVGQQVVAYPEKVLSAAGAANTNDSRAFRAEQEAAGLIVVKQSELDEINAMTEAVLKHELASAWLHLPGHAEASMFATDPETGLRLRCRFDYLPDDPRAAIDLKTTLDASPNGFAKRAHDLGYHVSRAHYLLTAELAEHPRQEMVFIAVENKAPYPVAVYQFDLRQIERGEKRARRARQLLVQCRQNDTWPGYSPDVEYLSEPAYAMYQDESEGI